MGVSKNRGTPKWMVYNGKPLLTWMIWGKTHYFGNTHIPVPWMVYGCIKSPIFLLGSLWLRYQDLPEPGPPTEPLTQLGTPLPGSQVKKAAEEAKEAKAANPGGVVGRSSSLSLRILAHRTSDDERLGCFPSSPKRKAI